MPEDEDKKPQEEVETTPAAEEAKAETVAEEPKADDKVEASSENAGEKAADEFAKKDDKKPRTAEDIFLEMEAAEGAACGCNI